MGPLMRTGDLEDPMGSRRMFRAPRGSKGAFRESKGVNRYVENPIGPWVFFDGFCDDS